MAVAITRTDLDAAGLRTAAAKDVASSRRMLALALVLEGASRSDAARAAGLEPRSGSSRQTLRDRVHRYNAAGLDGLRNQPNSGAPPRKLSAAQETTLSEWVRQSPSLARHKVVRWRLVDLRDEIAREFGVQMHERTVGKLLARLNFAHVSVRPQHPKQDVAAQQTHGKTSPRCSKPPSPSALAASQSSPGGRTKPASASKAA